MRKNHIGFILWSVAKPYYVDALLRVWSDLGPFLTGMARKRCYIGISHCAFDSCDHWNASYVTSFDQLLFEVWDRAIFYENILGRLLEYFCEKRRLLHRADSSPPDTSVLSLVTHVITRDCQWQVQSPMTLEDVLHALHRPCVTANENSNQSASWKP